MLKRCCEANKYRNNKYNEENQYLNLLDDILKTNNNKYKMIKIQFVCKSRSQTHNLLVLGSSPSGPTLNLIQSYLEG